MDDRDLRDRLRAADPASAFDALDTERISRMIERTTAAPEPPKRKARGWWVGGAGLAAAAALAVAIVVPLTRTPEPTRLTAPGGDAASAMCMAVTPELLAERDLAFQGTVSSIADGLVTLDVERVFKGDVASRAVVVQQDAEFADFSGTVFETGATYLVSTVGSEVAACGQSGPMSSELLALYEAAYVG